jgi:peptidoglycan/xylan/chitin deacetylase (PgdA/CDA1 family)
MPPAFWEIKDGQKMVGCTVHKVEATLDTGPIIAEIEVPIDKFSTPNGLRVRLDTAGNELLVEAIQKINNMKLKARPQCGQGRINSRPKLRLERQLLKDLAAKEGMTGPKQQAKDLIFTGYSIVKETVQRVRPSQSKSSVVVLLYHRVNDVFRDNVTIGIERFDQHMEYLKKYWPVVPLRALVRGEIDYFGHRPLVCITFDDGYRDNYDYATPVLLKHRLPATFFVSTDKITNQKPFEHDLRKLGKGLPNLNWDHARKMQQEGLDFGSHTVNHVNLARIALDEAWDELVESREALRRELGQDEFLFAYPFGTKSDITPEVINLVKKAGYECCCSAYGGTNQGNVENFDIRRIGVNYKFSLATLRSRLNGWV